jgi:hypothetical protein
MRSLLTFSLLLSAAPAWAEWVKSGESKDVVYYVDPASIRKEGSVRRFWAVQDMRESSPGGIMSIRALEEYDCAERKFRYLSISAHSGPMAGGQILLADNLADEWSHLPPGAASSTIQKIVCVP